jgi:AcrR family transcriptional regulator
MLARDSDIVLTIRLASYSMQINIACARRFGLPLTPCLGLQSREGGQFQGRSMATKRRMGPENAVKRTALLDAVEALMLEEGYAALSARNVAKRAGLKYQIVFYYFETMDDLLLAAYRRRTQSVLERIEEALASPKPLHAFWQLWSDPEGAALTIEYMALSNHNELIRAETAAFGEQMRQLVANRLSEVLRRTVPDNQAFTGLGVTGSLVSIGAILGFESAIGIEGGHRETQALVDWCVNRLEP